MPSCRPNSSSSSCYSFAGAGHRRAQVTDLFIVAVLLHGDDKVDALRLLAQYERAQPAVVHILVDKALALVVDDDAVGHAGGRVIGQADKALVHIDRRAAHRHTHEDSRAGVAGVADGQASWRSQHRRVLAQHLLVHDEPAGAQDDPLAGADIEFLLVLAHYQACHHTILIDDQGEGAGLVLHRDRFPAVRRFPARFS